ncbi:hypothetical protein [Bacillus thuringiensis]|uniref:hypothetical protein n=1 Tax=Bacillus thuringiensis TaxID=1428 RepID=UPI001F0B0327|nr:hypothetical protein [Bacillus thuringiensis]
MASISLSGTLVSLAGKVSGNIAAIIADPATRDVPPVIGAVNNVPIAAAIAKVETRTFCQVKSTGSIGIRLLFVHMFSQSL